MSSKKPIQNPHDRLFKITFSDPEEAASFLQAYLPTDLVAQLDWITLELVGGNYLDDALESSASDILFRIKTVDDAQEVLLYLLFEHQSTPDKWMRFRFLKYENRIWDELFKESPKPTRLLPIIPVVFYQGEKEWPYATQFSTLFIDDTLSQQEGKNALAPYTRFIPDFEHILIDHSGIELDEIKGALKARITQLLMWAAYHQPIQEALEIAARLLAQLPPSAGLNYLNIYITYLSATQTREIVTDFVETAQGQTIDIGGEMVPVIEAWTQESFQRGEAQGEIRGEIRGEITGEFKGEMRAKIDMIEGFLKTNVGWETITQATQINQKLYQSMKALYTNVISAVTPEVAEEVVREVDLETEYVTKRRAMVVKILDHRFQLSDEQQTSLLERLTAFSRREPLDSLVNSALIVEDLDLFEEELVDSLGSDAQPPEDTLDSTDS